MHFQPCVLLSLVHNIDADVDVDVDNRNESYSSVDVGVNIKGCRRCRGGFFEVQRSTERRRHIVNQAYTSIILRTSNSCTFFARCGKPCHVLFALDSVSRSASPGVQSPTRCSCGLHLPEPVGPLSRLMLSYIRSLAFWGTL